MRIDLHALGALLSLVSRAEDTQPVGLSRGSCSQHLQTLAGADFGVYCLAPPGFHLPTPCSPPSPPLGGQGDREDCPLPLQALSQPGLGVPLPG